MTKLAPASVIAIAFAVVWPVVLVAAEDAGRLNETGWPTIHGDLQRIGYHPHFPKPPFAMAWRKELWRELTGPRAEVVAGDGLAFMGTYAGKMYAWDIGTGEERWVVQTGGPVGHSPILDHGVLYFGSVDRKLRAVDAATGREKWSFEAEEGIWTSPLVHQGLVFFGARDGIFRAVDAASGQLRWQFSTGDRILTSASLSEDGRRVLFASEDMHLYCLEAGSGALTWKSSKLSGLTVRDYFPVVFRGLVFITTSPVRDFHATLDSHQQMLVKRTGFGGKDPRYIPGTPDDVRAEQDFIVEFLGKNPDEQTFHAFRVSDGTTPWIAPILYTGGLHNPPTPPCCNPETGDVFVQVRSAYTTWDGGGEVRPFTGFGKLDLATGRVELLEHGYPSKDPARPAGDKDKPWMTFNYIGDETQTLSCAPGLLLCTHQGYVGAMDLTTRRLEKLTGKRDTYGGFYGAGTFGWENQGGLAKAQAAGQPYGIVNEWHGPARAMVSVAGRRIFFHTGSQVICLEGRE